MRWGVTLILLGRSRHDYDLGIAGKSADGEVKARRRTVDSRVDLHAEQFCGAVHVGGDLDAADDAAGHALAVAADRIPAAQALWGVIERTQGEVGAWQDRAFLLACMYHGADDVAVQSGLQILNPKPCKPQTRRLLLMHHEEMAATRQKRSCGGMPRHHALPEGCAFSFCKGSPVEETGPKNAPDDEDAALQVRQRTKTNGLHALLVGISFVLLEG